MTLGNILSTTSFWQVNKMMAKKVGILGSVLLSDLVTKEMYFRKNGGLTDDGFFFNTASSIEQDTTIKPKKQRELIELLEKEGFIETKMCGMPYKKHFKINVENVLNHLVQKGSSRCAKMDYQDAPNLPIISNNNKINNNKERERENPAQKNSETEWDGEVNLNIPSLKDIQREQQKDAYATTTAIDFLRNNYPSRYEQQFKMKFSHKIKDQKRFISNFNDTVEIEGLAYESRKLFARLNKYATNWVENQGKFSNKPKDGKNGML